MELCGKSSGVNISDVIEVIETDTKMDMGRREGPYIKIIEQPASKALRFRYECEGRSAGSIPGVNSTPENKTYPTIQIVNSGRRRAVVVVSCVTKEAPHKPHPHNLVGRDGCKKGVCTVEVHNESMTQSFDHLGIQCIKKKDIEEALRAREEIRVDPYGTKFNHRNTPGSIDLNAVRLCFQAFLEDEPGKFKLALQPVVSDIIYDKKALCDLAICRLSHYSAPVTGGQEMILLCEKVAKEDISVRLFEVDSNNKQVWEGLCDFTPTQVHKQVAITFKTPKYKTIQVERPVEVFIQLRRPSDGETSEAVPFKLTPLDSGVATSEIRYGKRPKPSHDVKEAVLADSKMTLEYAASRGLCVGLASPRSQGPPAGLPVKLEPAETSPQPFLNVYHQGAPVSPSMYNRTPSPMELPMNQNYHGQGQVYTSALPHVSTILSPPTPSSIGRVSPHPSYGLPESPSLAQPVSNIVEAPPNGTFVDISGPSPMQTSLNYVLNSRDLAEYIVDDIGEGNLAENLSANLTLSTEPPVRQPTHIQENMTDSFTRLANDTLNDLVAYNKYDG